MMKVSVLMPCYNAERYVAMAIRSVLDQTHRDLELVVVDDGSKDASADVVAGFTDPRLRLLRQANKGQCAAANVAYAACTGELIKFFDADDVLDPDHISRQVARLADRRDAVVVGEWRRFYGETPGDEPFEARSMYRDADPADWLIAEWRDARPMMQCALWLIPRPVLDRSGLWDERLSLINDFEFFTRVLLSANAILYAPGARLHYRSGVGGSLSGSTSRKAVESQLLSLLLGTERLLAVRTCHEARLSCANLLRDFDYMHYPNHPDLRARARRRARELGGSTLQPDGPPGFHRARKIIGWRLARRLQRFAEAYGLTTAGRAAAFAHRGAPR